MTGKNNQSNQSNQGNQNDLNNQNSTSTGGDENGTIEGQAKTGAAGSTAEDTLDEYKALIEQMKSQNEALLNQNQSLQSQFETLIRNGASVTQQQQSQQAHDNGPDDVGENYTSLADLGGEIGKRDYKSHNMKE